MTFAWIPYRKHHEPQGDWVWGGQLGSPRELIAQKDGTLTVRLVPEVAASYKTSVAYNLNAQLGNWQQDGQDVTSDATGSYSYCYLTGLPREEVMLDTTIEISSGTQAVGVLLEPEGEELSSGYYLAIEPLKERVVFDKWPVTMDPLWDSLVLTERHGISTRQEIDTPAG